MERSRLEPTKLSDVLAGNFPCSKFFLLFWKWHFVALSLKTITFFPKRFFLYFRRKFQSAKIKIFKFSLKINWYTYFSSLGFFHQNILHQNHQNTFYIFLNALANNSFYLFHKLNQSILLIYKYNESLLESFF